MKYDVAKEQINIENYSPFSCINEVSPEYRSMPFLLPSINFEGERPVHPDTFTDLKLNESQIVKQTRVFPTSSFRTVYEPKTNTCLKLPLKRKITRGLRDLSDKSMARSEHAAQLLSKINQEGFSYLPEACHYASNPDFNFIERKMPDSGAVPWFYVIKANPFEKKQTLTLAENIIKTWLSLARRGLYLEAHTQNILVTQPGQIIYRDLSDVRCLSDPVLRPSYADHHTLPEVLATTFDRSVCNQNLDHLFRYQPDLACSKNKLKEIIKEEIKANGLEFPSYSMDFPKDHAERIPEKVPLIWWRDFS